MVPVGLTVGACMPPRLQSAEVKDAVIRPVAFIRFGRFGRIEIGLERPGQYEPDACPQHGFARRSEFALAASTATMCRYELIASEATRAVYPFDFQLALVHAAS